ncbi:MAG: iron-sulfur cluster carrier protein ApbC [Janthinobacterium lividum]
MTIQENLTAALEQLVDPQTSLSFKASRSQLTVAPGAQDGHFTVQLVLGYPAQSRFDALRQLVEQTARAQPGVTAIDVTVSQRIVAHAVQRGLARVPGVKNLIAVGSAKGGVGKSTTAVNIALSLAAEGATVGMLDADIYGPSLPLMLGIHGKPESQDGKTMNPLEGHGLQANSIGFLIGPDEAMIWRGPMVTSAFNQLLTQTNWRDLDYLIVDMPPGTGDIQLTLSQKAPVTGAVIVTTPQDLALLDARRGLKMFEKVNVPVLGVVENMGVHICSNCGHAEHIFGAGGGAAMCAQYGVDFLGSLPLDISIRAGSDIGEPSVVTAPDSVVALLYRQIASSIAARVAALPRDFSGKLPAIVVEKS